MKLSSIQLRVLSRAIAQDITDINNKKKEELKASGELTRLVQSSEEYAVLSDLFTRYPSVRQVYLNDSVLYTRDGYITRLETNALLKTSIPVNNTKIEDAIVLASIDSEELESVIIAVKNKFLS